MWQVRRITGTQSEKREDTLIDTEALLSNATNTWLRKLDEIKSDAQIKNYLMTEISKIKKRIPDGEMVNQSSIMSMPIRS